ncbi:MAG: enterotoxin [Akkermansiaceae bacterium]|nr:enterotoxin [Akkermansiaceae bacterium]
MLENEYIRIDIRTAGRALAGVTVQDKVNGRSYDLGREIFNIQLQEAKTDEACSKKEYTDVCLPLSALDLMCGEVQYSTVEAAPTARRLAERRAAQRAGVAFAVTTDGYKLEWWAELRAGQPYCRIGLDITPMQFAMPARKITLLCIAAPEARVEGTVKGAPVVAAGNRLFAGVESPLSKGEITADGFACTLERTTHLPARTTSRVSAVLGFCSPGQLRRTFQLAYLNEERARPYFPLFNYNTWYDIGYFTPYSEKDVLDTVRLFGEEMVSKRGAVIDSFLLDDGWDNTETLWQFHDGLPHEFREIRKLMESYGSAPGVWFSPWGGYGQPKLNRLAAAGDTYETNERGFALSGPKYYELFREMCLHMIRENGVNHFKLDGCSGMAEPVPGSRFGSDFEAAISLIDELRAEKPDIYINLTTGTWASPFWFSIADSVWRGNWDHDFCGVGTARQQWITFRDAMIYAHNVKISPLCPINSLMTHGVIYNKGARGLMTTENDDLADEIWSGLGLGTQMQEVYITPAMLQPHEWDTLAAAAKWTRANADTLVDSHWVGGDPAALEAYGFASWSPAKGILVLRNPSDREQEFAFDPAAVFELPLGAALRYALSSPKGDELPAEVAAGVSTSLRLKPFGVLVIEAAPMA